jgi:hypothetical protein
MKYVWIAAALGCVAATPAWAAPGMADEIYGATVEKGEVEIESRYGRLGGGPDDGEDAVKLEAAYGVSSRLRLAAFGEFEREAGDHRKATEAGIEAIYALGNAGGVDFALYGEYAIGLNGEPDGLEGKLLMQHRRGPLDVRLNLIAEKPLRKGEKVELSYAASADYAVAGEFRLGAQAVGDLGTFDHLFPHAEHFIGPAAKFEVEGLGPEFSVEAGYLFAIGKTRDDTKGQLRLGVELEF